MSDLVGSCSGLEQKELKELKELEELQLAEVLVKWMTQFVLKLACLVDSEVDGSGKRTAVWISVHQAQCESPLSPFWHFLLLLIPC